MRPEYDELCAEVKRLRNDLTEIQKLCKALLRPKKQNKKILQKKKLDDLLNKMVDKHNQKFKH